MFVDLEDVEVPGEKNKGFPIIMKNFNNERFIMVVQCNRKSHSYLSLAKKQGKL